MQNTKGFNLRVFIKRDGVPVDLLFNTEGETVYTREVHSQFFNLNSSLIYADPFLFVYNDTLYLFYEQQNYKENGVIKMTKTSDLKHWSNPVTVLRESFHLSFPFVFKYKGEVYMMPETGQSNSIRLYKAQNDKLTNFSLVKELIAGSIFLDSSICKEKDCFYLFTTEEYEPFKYMQRLYCSKDIMGAWIEHPKSPIYVGGLHGRNAGSIFHYNDRLYRPTQDCSVAYGKNVAIMQIDEISTEEYAETEVVARLIDTTNAFYANGGHQFNFVEFKGQLIIATDAKWSGGKPNLGIVLCKIKNRIKAISNVKN